MTGVYIVGGDHHNGYGLARHFGANGVDVYSIVISDRKKSWLSKSKYIKKSYIFSCVNDAFDYLENANNSEKALIIPYSDAAALELDNRIKRLRDNYIFPSFKEVPGKICTYMDKMVQYNIARNNNIPVAYSEAIDLYKLGNQWPDIYPCIVKPQVSAEGKKSDITVCYNQDQLTETIDRLRKEKYKKLIIQEFIDFEYEIDAFGAIDNGKILSIFPHKILRRWPSIGGTCSYTQAIVDEKIIKFCKVILDVVCEQGYSGLYDLELFFHNGKLYFNELNYRCSGSSFRSLGQHFYYVYDWYNSKISGKTFNQISVPSKKTYSMTEYTDFRHILNGEITFCRWIKDFKKSSCFSLLCTNDLKPIIFKVIYSIGGRNDKTNYFISSITND